MDCSTCHKYNTCIKICNKLENYLQREQSKQGYSDRHIRRKEKQFDPFVMNILVDNPRKGWQKAGGGYRKKPLKMDDFD